VVACKTPDEATHVTETDDSPELSRVAKQDTRFSLVDVEGETLLVDAQSEAVIYMDKAASVVWMLCDGQRRLADIAALIAEAYPEDRDRVVKDVRLAVRSLCEQGALSLEP
jgi:hypothetical protein